MSLASAATALGASIDVRPSFFVGVAYDTNVFGVRDSRTADWLGVLALRVPVTVQAGEHLRISGDYTQRAEFYDSMTVLNSALANQAIDLGTDFDLGRRSNLSLRIVYGESLRASDLYPDAGLEFERSRTRYYSGNARLTRQLGNRTDLGLAYGYSRSRFADGEGLGETHDAGVDLTQALGRSVALRAEYDFHRFEFEDGERVSDHVVLGGMNLRLGRSWAATVMGGARILAGGRSQPEASASLTRPGQRFNFGVSYTKSRGFVPIREGLSDADSVVVNVSYQARRLQVGLSPGYYRNRFDQSRIESYRASINAVYQLKRWLGLSSSGSYVFQETRAPGPDGAFGTTEGSRTLFQVGLVLSPWNQYGSGSGR